MFKEHTSLASVIDRLYIYVLKEEISKENEIPYYDDNTFRRFISDSTNDQYKLMSNFIRSIELNSNTLLS